MDTLDQTNLAAFIQSSWEFHARHIGGNQAVKAVRTTHDLGTHFGFTPNEAVSAVRHHAAGPSPTPECRNAGHSAIRERAGNRIWPPEKGR
jgi:hypothetical protein